MFLKNFLKDFQNFRKVFPNVLLIFLNSKCLQILLKTNTFF